MNRLCVMRWMGGGLLLAVLLPVAAIAADVAPLEEERVHPGEITFEQGVAWYYDGGERIRLSSRREGGELVYYRMVRYDPQDGYLDADGHAALAYSGAPRPSTSESWPRQSYGNGLYGPDFFRSPYNRDARQRYVGPGYVGACDWRGCREMHYLPYYPGYYR